MPSEDVERPTIADILRKVDLEKYSRGGQVGNFKVDLQTIHNLSASQMADANDLLYTLKESYPQYEFMVTDDFVGATPGVLISWRRKPDDDREHGAALQGS